VIAQGKGNKERVLLSALGSEEEIYSTVDCGMFAAIFTAYNHRYKLRTSPDDWWFMKRGTVNRGPLVSNLF